MNGALALLLSRYYDGVLAPEHTADLAKSGLREDTIRRHCIRSVPPSMIRALLGWDHPAIRSAYLIPYPEPPAGHFGDFFQLRLFPPIVRDGYGTFKYAQPRRSGTRLFFPLPTLEAALEGDRPLWLLEGAKKSLATAQLGLPSIGFSGIESWHLAGSRVLLPDFNDIRLAGRVVELVPDGDVRTNLNVARGAERFAEALEVRGAQVRVVVLPVEVPA